MVRSLQQVRVIFVTSVFATGALDYADADPTGTLYVNGVANGATVTMTGLDLGLYRASFNLPALSIGDLCSLAIEATVGGVTAKNIVWYDFVEDINFSTKRNITGCTALFTITDFATGAAVDADSLPTGHLYVNAAQDSSATITNISTGLYKAAVTFPTVLTNATDIFSILITATVGGVDTRSTIWGNNIFLNTAERINLRDELRHR